MISRYGRYEVLYKLGQGAMAQVFLARDPVLSRFVAVKVLHAELAARKDVLQRFFNEARTVAVVRNPHVVEVFDFGQEGKDLYLVMEFVDGLSLHGVLRQLRINQRNSDRLEWRYGSTREDPLFFDPLDPTVTAALICQAAEGLSVAAQHGVVHRDIKPENLMINTQGYLKISDFGIAHVQDDSITKTGAVLGSPLFMSPEQARGIKPITSQADMFSLGAVFYSCLAGHPPFQGKNITDLFRKIATQQHTPLWRLRPDLDPALGNLIETLLQKDPAKRGGGPRWLHRQLKGYLMALRVMDPAELIGGYLQELSARGVQTTWRMDAPDVSSTATTLASGTVPNRAAATERYTREASPRLPAAAFGAALGVLGLAAGIAAWGFLRHSGSVEQDRRVHLEAGSGAHGNIPGTLAAFGLPSDPRRDGGAVAAGPGPAGVSRDAAGQAGDTSVAGGSAGARQGLADSGAAADAADPDIDARRKDREEAASLVLKSSPPFAETFVDGRYVGVTPVRVDLMVAGRHRVVFRIKNKPVFDSLLALRPGVQGYKFRMDEGLPSRLAAMPEEAP